MAKAQTPKPAKGADKVSIEEANKPCSKDQRQPRGRKPRAESVPAAALADAVADTAIMPSEPAAANTAPAVRTLRLWASGVCGLRHRQLGVRHHDPGQSAGRRQCRAGADRLGFAYTCAGINIGGDLVVTGNCAEALVFDNQVTGALQANNNTGALDIVGNTVATTLQCQNNTMLVMGGDNTVEHKTGQCN